MAPGTRGTPATCWLILGRPMRLCTFEDSGVAGLEPLACARPAFDLLCGTVTLFEKHVRTFRHTALGALVRPAVARVTARDHPHVTVNESAWLARGSAILVN